jgi:uridine kinase
MSLDTPPLRDPRARPGILIVGIAGPSGSGKTTLARAAAERCDGVVLALDAYYRDQRHETEDTIDVDIPDAIEAELALAHVQRLAAGEEIAQPVYDFATHARTEASRVVRPARVILVEGLFAFYWRELRELMDRRIFVALDHEQCLRRRSERDQLERGRTVAEVTSTYERKVRPMFERYVAPTRAHAHVVLDGSRSVDRLLAELLVAIDG